MRLYVSGPMTGLPDFNYPAFEVARQTLADVGYDVLSPTDNHHPHAANADTDTWVWYMRQALKQVADADGVAVLPGAACSRGALLEIVVARGLALPVLSVGGWVNRGGK